MQKYKLWVCKLIFHHAPRATCAFSGLVEEVHVSSTRPGAYLMQCILIFKFLFR